MEKTGKVELYRYLSVKGTTDYNASAASAVQVSSFKHRPPLHSTVDYFSTLWT